MTRRQTLFIITSHALVHTHIIIIICLEDDKLMLSTRLINYYLYPVVLPSKFRDCLLRTELCTVL